MGKALWIVIAVIVVLVVIVLIVGYSGKDDDRLPGIVVLPEGAAPPADNSAADSGTTDPETDNLINGDLVGDDDNVTFDGDLV